MTSRKLLFLFSAAALLTGHHAIAQAVSVEVAKQRVFDGLQLTASVKTATAEYLNRNSRFPTSIEEAGVKANASNDSLAKVSVTSVNPENEVVIKVTYGAWARPTNVLVLRGNAMRDDRQTLVGVTFRCSAEGSTIDQAWLTDGCKLK